MEENKMIKILIQNLNTNDPFFDELKRDYKNFEKWIGKKRNDYAYCIFQKNNLKALLILKVEDHLFNDYRNITPKMKINKKLKISTFKVDIPNLGIATKFMQIINNEAILNDIDEIYLTIFDNSLPKKNLIKFLKNYDFNYFGKKTNNELVYVKKIK